MGLFVLSKMIAVQALLADPIGQVSELNGTAEVLRDQAYNAELNFAIQQDDIATTKEGRLGLTFLDDSQVRLTEYSKLKITKYIFDPDPKKSEMGIEFTLGTARFITGKFNKISKQNIALSTPTADIAIRGTDFTATVDELGRSLIVLLPDEFGLSSGEIEVITAGGTVVLNRPFQATTVSVFESAPSKPVILDLSLDLIDNMLIVSPPKEEILQEETENQVRKSDILDFNDLDIDYLAEDFLDTEDLEFTELDINYLDVNFLEDLLDLIDALAVAEEEDVLAQATSVNITGTTIGQDRDTGITTIIDGEIITLARAVSESANLRLNVSGSYTVIFIQDGVSRTVKINGGGDSTITIKQSD
jgi:virulence-associated protein VagC